MIRPVWLQFRASFSLTATGTTIVDLLATHLDALQQSSRVIVAIKGSMGTRANTTSATVDDFETQAGFFVGANTLTAALVPVLSTDGVINPGFMWRRGVTGGVVGDGTAATQVFNENHDFDVKSKRSLTGLGDQTLWLQHRVSAAVSVGTCVIVGQILLASKG